MPSSFASMRRIMSVTTEEDNLLENINASTVSSWDVRNIVLVDDPAASSSSSSAPPSLLLLDTNNNNNQTQLKTIKEIFYNGTGYYIEDESDTGLNDLQTLFLACFATLIPLVISLITAFGIRILWTRYKRRKENEKYDGILHRRNTTNSGTAGHALHTHLLSSEKSAESHLVAISTDDDVVVCDSTTGASQLRPNNHSNTNGSIITMTLKNNHLIVETEERNDLEEDSRETTMKYSPGARDGVFVVEVQQGVRRSPGTHNHPPASSSNDTDAERSDQCALVHNPPPDRYDDEKFVESSSPVRDVNDDATSINSRRLPLAKVVQTGLAQSSTSLTSSSSSSHHPSYCYTNQQCYDNGGYGYPIYNGYVNDERTTVAAVPLPIIKRALDNDSDNISSSKPKIMAAVYKKTPPSSSNYFDRNITSSASLRDSSGQVVASGDGQIQQQDVRSADYENKGFDECNNDTTKS